MSMPRPRRAFDLDSQALALSQWCQTAHIARPATLSGSLVTGPVGRPERPAARHVLMNVSPTMRRPRLHWLGADDDGNHDDEAVFTSTG